MSERKRRHEMEVEETRLPIGSIVWATLNKKQFWPAMIVNNSVCACAPAKRGNTWVYWFGDHRVSQVQWSRVSSFQQTFHQSFIKSNFTPKWRKGIMEAVKEYAIQVGYQSRSWSETDCIEWCHQDFMPSDPNIDTNITITENVMTALAKVRRKNSEDSDFDVEELNSSQLDIQQGVKDRSVLLETVCVCCYSHDVEDKHPLFRARVCKSCKEKVKSTMYAYGSDSINYFCAICTKPGEVLVCDNKNCGRVYCFECIDTLCAKNAKFLIRKMDPWYCFLCSEFVPKINGILMKHDDWELNIIRIFNSTNNIFKELPIPKEKRPARVLSLFDGIGTGRLVLEKLGIEIEAYFSYEIDSDAINVLKTNYSNKITHMGDVVHCTASSIDEMTPIDIILGASPCNDLSLVNPVRKGIFETSGSGVLFFDFYRILKMVQERNKDREVLWLFENVASMTKETKEIINRFLEREPCMLDARWFSPQHRARLFWGNIPGLHGNVPIAREEGPLLDSYLTAYTNRKAVMDKIRTVTTNPNSLKQGCNMTQYPVQTSAGDGDTIWITELEEIFGFPRHYTDVGNISLLNRQHLLGRAWSVPVVLHILQSLRHYFRVSEPGLEKNGISSTSDMQKDSQNISLVLNEPDFLGFDNEIINMDVNHISFPVNSEWVESLLNKAKVN